MSSPGAGNWGPDEIVPAMTPLLIGRDGSAGTVLGHPAVSRRHALLFFTKGRLMVRDLGSRFGTRVNWKPVRESPLAEGDRIEFGAVAYEVRGGRLALAAGQEAGLRLEARSLEVSRGQKR